MLKREKRTLADQLKRAKKEYPILALAYEIQQVTIGELLGTRSLDSTHMGPLYEAVSGPNAPHTEDSVERERKLERLLKCLGRASTYASGLDCFDKYG